MNEEQIKNKLAYNGTVYKFKTDTAPVRNSVNPISSGAIYDIVDRLQGVIDREVAPQISGAEMQQSEALVTVGALIRYLQNIGVVPS